MPTPSELEKDTKGKLKKLSSLEEKKIKYFIVILFAVLVFATIALNIASLYMKSDGIPKCGDGTFYSTCSLDKPYFCQDGTLISKSSVCGCGNNGLFAKQDESCVSPYYANSRNVTFNYLLGGEKKEINFKIYGGVYNYTTNLSRDIYYEGLEIPFRADFKIKSIEDKIQRATIIPLVKEIENIAPSDKVQQARIAISIVQNIPYGFSDKNETFLNREINHSRYPYEVLYDNEGICGEKSQLLALLLKELGYGVSIFYYADENHEAVGIKCPVEKSSYKSGYCFIETGGNSIITDSGIEFVGGTTLDSTPEILLVSEGISLPDKLPEYRDAKTLDDIRKGNILGLLKFWKLDSIREKYGLAEVYELR